MVSDPEMRSSALSSSTKAKAELQAKMRPNADADERDREYWRQASPAERGRALKDVLDVASTILQATGRQGPEDIPHFPKPRHDNRSEQS